MNAPPDHSLFPPIEPRRTGMLAVDALHTIYWEESGSPDGIPVVYVHGGPGGGSSPDKRQWFDPDAWRIILFDQRGAFRSTPLAEVRANTTPLLVEDMETLRRLLGIERWLLAAGSWGTTLSLAYAQAHPDACLGLVLRGVFLGTSAEIDWFMHGMRKFYPEAHEAFAGWLPAAERDDPLAAYERRLFGDDPAVRMEAARRWFAYSESCSLLRHDPRQVEEACTNEPVVYGTGRLDAFFFRNRMFLEEDQLIRDMGRIAHLPGLIVQGGHDVIAPPEAAWRLHRAWPGSIMQVAPDAGHSPSEPGLRTRLMAGLEHYKRDGRFAAESEG